MSSRDLLLEIGLEEIPARFVLGAIEQLQKKIEDWLTERKIQFGDVKAFSTPRRLAVLVTNVAESQKDTELEVKGPTKKIAIDQEGNWSKAAMGFSKSQGVAVDDIFFKEIKGTEYAFVQKFEKGQTTETILPDLKEIITSLHFPNNMHWGDLNTRYIRPIRWIVALFGQHIIPFTVANVNSGNITYGHRFLGSEINLALPAEYEKILLSQYVIADYEKRKSAIEEQIAKLADEHHWLIPIDPSLLEEVTNLVEYPTAFYGSFRSSFLELPKEVLITSMKEHQRYFPVEDHNGQLLPYFIAVRNGDHRQLETVIKGNEKVLRARLQDAEFFYHEDQKLTIAQALEKLNNIVYHEKLGTLSEKVNRVMWIAKEIAYKLNVTDEELATIGRATEISKFDLVTNMVDEFPELQGIMGEKYALLQGEKPEVAQAIKEHYQPIHPEDPAPNSMIGSVVSVADKLDSIVSFFSIGLIPTGSQDPYALRRQAAGIVKILQVKNWNVTLPALLDIAIKGNHQENNQELFEQLKKFFRLRLNYLLEEKGIRYDIVEAILDSKWTSIPEILKRAEVLENNSQQPQFKTIVEALSRVLNIASKAEGTIAVDKNLFENEYEKNLYEKWQQVEKQMNEIESVDARYQLLASLEPIISSYFDHTMVMAENESVKNNRLAQMENLAEFIYQFADMNKILVK
ncbi:glycine--tRNA ligase subunit beta [Lederbergia galactosidilytica]|uniref:Glycine--tRNA ligase beta subunit n=1 Tax=Lederbergia galactosidilytica TaxID=217031 RepID=A0A178A6I6_9BACI|nr:glycine--tRNA ligase subunit beta [Lederbergia galactosidilytica]OAK74708.1 glycine-tRNA synthetase subunit beta [Lederbergia galactosidilytica]